MSVSRRNFITSGAAMSAAALTATKTASAQGFERTNDGVLNLSSQEGMIPGKTLEEKLDHMEEWGFVGIELGGHKLWERVGKVQKALQGRNIKVSAICAGFDGVPASHDPGQRKRAVESIKKIVEAAGELGSTGLIIVPAFNSQTSLGVVGARYEFIELAPEIAEAAHKAGTRILIEPLNRWETWYVRLLADAAAICDEVDHPGMCLMGDFYHMGIEEPCEYSAFLAARKYLHHVHLASRPERKQPGYNKSDFRPGFRALKEIGYKDYCSFECGIEGKAIVEIPKSLEYLKQQWEEA